MPRILVTPLSALEETLESQRPSHLVSLLSPGHMIETPAGFAPARHLKLELNDIVDPAEGMTLPAREHIDTLLAFAHGWDGRAPLLVHCWAGISRSMASAFTILCARAGKDHEVAIARAIRRRAPHANPNRLMVSHADDALGRGGRMLAALNTMGQPLMVTEGMVTALPLENP